MVFYKISDLQKAESSDIVISEETLGTSQLREAVKCPACIDQEHHRFVWDHSMQPILGVTSNNAKMYGQFM